jgi:hypothetical protein
MNLRPLLVCVAMLVLTSVGCTEYVELRNTSDRIWIMSKDGQYVLRCIDATPDQKPFVGNAKVFCKTAYMYGTVTAVDVDASAMATPPPPGKPQPASQQQPRSPVEGEMK